MNIPFCRGLCESPAFQRDKDFKLWIDYREKIPFKYCGKCEKKLFSKTLKAYCPCCKNRFKLDSIDGCNRLRT